MLEAPPSTSTDDLRSMLEAIADELMVEVRLSDAEEPALRLTGPVDEPDAGACDPVRVVTSTGLRPTRRWLGPVVADLVCVLALAIGGKNSHEAGDSDWVVLVIVWPFALAAAAAHVWLVARGAAGELGRPEGELVPGGDLRARHGATCDLRPRHGARLPCRRGPVPHPDDARLAGRGPAPHPPPRPDLMRIVRP